MKRRPLFLFALLAVLAAASVSPLSAATALSPAEADSLSAGERYDPTVTRPGDSAARVAAGLGALLAVLGAALAVKYRDALLVWPGDSPTTTMRQLGQPDQKLSGDTWVYRRFQSRYDLRYDEDCTTLLVTFREGRVAALDRVNEPAVRWLAAKLAAPPYVPGIVAKQ